MATRNAYHTDVKILVREGLLPDPYLRLVPRTNRHRWRNESKDKYISVLNQAAKKRADLIRFVDEYPAPFLALRVVLETIVNIFSETKDFSKRLREHKKEIVEAITTARKVIPLDEVVRLFRISRPTFYTWLTDVRCQCKTSAFGLCNRFHPQQLSFKEVGVVRTLMQNQQLQHWSLHAINAHAFRKDLLKITDPTFNKYTRLLGLGRETVLPVKKTKHKKGKHAEAPNQMWHADVTIIKSAEGIPFYLYLVMDNYSRFIVSHVLSKSLSAKIRLTSLQMAYRRALKASKEPLNIDLITDGGPENVNKLVKGYVQDSQINMRQQIALKDVRFSNSMVEAAHKVLKYWYLKPKGPLPALDIPRNVAWSIEDYSFRRAHSSLGLLTPFESWNGQTEDKEQTKADLEQSRIKRIATNQQNLCGSCSDLK